MLCANYFFILLFNMFIRENFGDIVTDMISETGYPYEIHDIETEDSYLLRLYRLPQKKPTNQVALLMHGFISCGADYLTLGPDNALGYMLYDRGYDIWLGNARGTTFSRGHKYLDSKNSSLYWDFSWHEIGKYDLPAMIDEILKITNQSAIQYVGHSQGTTVAMVLLSMRPEYNEKIISMHLMAPAVFFRHPNIIFRTLSERMNPLLDVAVRFDINDIPATNGALPLIADIFCQEGKNELCKSIYYIFAFVGSLSLKFNTSLIPTILKTTPSGSSVKQLTHFAILINSGDFILYDYGEEKNMQIYHSELPPIYDLSNIKTKIQLIYGSVDIVCNPADTLILKRRLHKQVIDVIKMDDWGHLDFIFSSDASIVYRKLINTMKKQF